MSWGGATALIADGARRALGWLIVAALVLVRTTWRVRVVGSCPDGPVLIAFWHGSMLALSSALGRAQVAPALLVSRSRDGQVGATVASALGLRVVRGSSSRGAVAAGRALRRCLAAGGAVALAVDGPRGPARQTSDAGLRLAAAAEALVVPVAAVGCRSFTLGTWDRFAIPAPFTRVVVAWGEPVEGGLQEGLDRLGHQAAGLAAG